MKTPLQQLLDYTTDLLYTFDSEERVAMAVLDYLKTNKKSMLEKEKDAMVDFAYKCRNVMAGDEFAITHWYDKTFASNVSELVCVQCGGKKNIMFSAMRNFQAYCEDCREPFNEK